MLNQSRMEICATWLKTKVPYGQNKVKHIDVRERNELYFAILTQCISTVALVVHRKGQE